MINTTSTNSSQPKVSIIVPCFNSSAYIGATIESVLKQSFKLWELIIIDDGSTDSSKEIIMGYAAKNPGIRLVQHAQNLGISKTRNEGISIARGEYVAMLDSDDIWLDAEKLSKQVEFLEANAGCVLVGTWMQKIDANGIEIQGPGGKVSFGETDADIRKNIAYRNHIAQSSVVFRKEIAVEVGGYDEKLSTMEDHDLWLKMGTKGSFATLPIYALAYRMHPGGITKRRMIRVMIDKVRVILRHRNAYPGGLMELMRGFGRFIKRTFARAQP